MLIGVWRSSMVSAPACHKVGHGFESSCVKKWIADSHLYRQQYSRASDCQCRRRNSPGFDLSSDTCSEILGAAGEAVLNTVHRKKVQKIPRLKIFTTKNRKVLNIFINVGGIWLYILCNGGALYAPYSFLRFSNMLCDGRVLARWGGEGWNRVVKLLYDPVFRVIK
jgi:hypothetical protein